jgi:DNA replication protein DnaC
MDRVDRLLTALLRPRLLILDEIGYTPLERPEATFLFEIVAKRYDRRKPLIVTSNKSWSAWGDILPDQVMTAAILDRLLHRSITLNIQGESYRLRQHRSAGLIPSPLGSPQGGDCHPKTVKS